MANITTLRKDGTTHVSMAGVTHLPYWVELEIDIEDAIAAKGSALAALDTIEAITVPAGTVILHVGAAIVTPATTTTATIDVGFTGGDVDEFVDGFDIEGTAGTYAPYLAFDPTWIAPIATADTIDVLFATLTGTLSAGKFRVYALLLDVSAKKSPGLVQLGS